MRFLGDEYGEPLRADRREVDLAFHGKRARGSVDAFADRVRIESARRPRGLQGHAKMAARDLFLHGLDVGAELKKELRDAGDDARLVVSDKRNSRDVLGHSTLL